MKRPSKPPPAIVDEPGMEERFQRALRKALDEAPDRAATQDEGAARIKGARSQEQDAELAQPKTSPKQSCDSLRSP
jgi:hypothetical protein